MIVITSRQLWENYDRFTALDSLIIRETKTEYIDSRVYFNGFKSESGTVRCYARLIAPLSADVPVLICLLPFDQSIDDVAPQDVLKTGYATLLVDYAGKSNKKSHYTVYPRSINAEWETNPESIYKPPADAKTSCHFYWTSCVVHAITYLEELGYKDRIGIVGFKEGAGLVFKTSLISGIKCGATFFGGDIWGSGEEYLAYKAALDSRSYAENCFPVLINATTNEKNGALDYLNDLYLSAPEARFSILANADTAVSDSQRINLKKWFDSFFYGNQEIPPCPEISVSCSEGTLYVEINGNYESVRIYTAEDRMAFSRNWIKANTSKIGENKFLAKIKVFDIETSVLMFASVKYQDGFVFSTPITIKNPQKLGVKAEPDKNRILYRASQRGTWLVENGSFFEYNKAQVKKGPFDLEGIAGDKLVTFAPGDAYFRGNKDNLLQIIIHSEIVQDVEFCAIVFDSTATEYKCKKVLSNNGWSTITLSSEDFKSQKGIPSFNKTVGISIKGKGLIVNSVVWI